MADIVEITDFSAPELDVYARLTGAQLRACPQGGLFIAEGVTVIGHALDAGYRIASLLMERRFLAWKSALHINDKSTGWRIFMTVRTALLVFIGRYFTRAPRLTVVFSLLKTTVLYPNFGELPHKILTLGLTAGDLLIVAAGILIVHIVEFFEERGTDVRGWLNARKSSVQVLILLVSLLILAFFGIFRSGYISSEFIYGQF